MGQGYSMKARAEEAEVYIYEDIGESWFGGVSAKQFAADLKALGDISTIHAHINSYGGEVFDAVAIYRQLADHPAKVIVYIDGVAASSAATIAMAGDEIRISQAGMVMIHNASGVCFGEAKDMRQLADLLDTISGTIGDVYAARTGQSAEQIKSWMDVTTWMTAEDAVANKFADSIMENLRVAASAGDPREVYAAHARPKPRDAALLIAAANETMAIGTAPEEPAKPAPSPLAARVALQAARLAALPQRTAA